LNPAFHLPVRCVVRYAALLSVETREFHEQVRSRAVRAAHHACARRRAGAEMTKTQIWTVVALIVLAIVAVPFIQRALSSGADREQRVQRCMEAVGWEGDEKVRSVCEQAVDGLVPRGY